MNKKNRIPVQKRFPAGDTNSVKPACALFQKLQYISETAFKIRFAAGHQYRIMTKRTPEITAAGENRAGKVSRIIQ